MFTRAQLKLIKDCLDYDKMTKSDRAECKRIINMMENLEDSKFMAYIINDDTIEILGPVDTLKEAEIEYYRWCDKNHYDHDIIEFSWANNPLHCEPTEDHMILVGEIT